MGNRVWTPAMQTTAEVAAACGVSVNQIRKVLGVNETTVRYHLIMGVAKAERERNRRWRQENPEARREQDRRYYQAHPEVVSERNRRRYLANLEAARERSCSYYYANLEAQRERRRSWRQNNPEVVREIRRRHNARKRAANRVAPIPLTLTTKQHIFALWDERCAYCDANGATTVDHVVPLIHGGLDEPSNVVPACRSCNCKKNASPMEKWYRRQSFFCEARLSKIRHHTSRITQPGEWEPPHSYPRSPSATHQSSQPSSRSRTSASRTTPSNSLTLSSDCTSSKQQPDSPHLSAHLGDEASHDLMSKPLPRNKHSGNPTAPKSPF